MKNTVLLFSHVVGIVVGMGLGVPDAAAQATFADDRKFAHGANTGWVNFRPSASNGVQVTETYLSGYAYGANSGWINMGDGTPDNGHTYANTGSDFGVNLSPAGILGGYAWGANTGWIRFDWTDANDPNAPRVDYLTGAVTGFAYSANTGWIVLGASGHPLATETIDCPDSDADGIGDAWEQLHFGTLATVGIGTDHDMDGVSDASEFIAGTDPDDADSTFRIVDRVVNGDQTETTVTFTTVTGRVYRVESTVDVVNGPWIDSSHGTFLADSGSATTTKVIVTPRVPRRYFRTVVDKPLP